VFDIEDELGYTQLLNVSLNEFDY